MTYNDIVEIMSPFVDTKSLHLSLLCMCHEVKDGTEYFAATDGRALCVLHRDSTKADFHKVFDIKTGAEFEDPYPNYLRVIPRRDRAEKHKVIAEYALDAWRGADLKRYRTKPADVSVSGLPRFILLPFRCHADEDSQDPTFFNALYTSAVCRALDKLDAWQSAWVSQVKRGEPIYIEAAYEEWTLRVVIMPVYGGVAMPMNKGIILDAADKQGVADMLEAYKRAIKPKRKAKTDITAPSWLDQTV